MSLENIKNKDAKEKIEIIKNYLLDEKSNDKVLALNVFLLIKRNNTFDDSFFEHKDVIFNDVMEFIDIADELHSELENFISKLLGVYLSCIKNCSLVVSDQSKHIPTNILYVLYMMDYLTLSTLINNNDIQEDNTHYDESYEVVVSLSEKISYLFNLLDNSIKNDN